jgi:hypothetical protein
MFHHDLGNAAPPGAMPAGGGFFLVAPAQFFKPGEQVAHRVDGLGNLGRRMASLGLALHAFEVGAEHPKKTETAFKIARQPAGLRDRRMPKARHSGLPDLLRPKRGRL